MSSVKVGVAAQRLVVGETVGDQEMDVAVLGVTEDHRIPVAIPVEQFVQARAGVGQQFDRHHHVLEQRCRTRRAGSGDRRVETFAQLPQPAPHRRIVGQFRRMLQRQAGQHRRRGLGQRGQLVAVGGLVFQQQGRLPGDLEGGDLGRRVGQSLPDPQRHVVQQLQGGRAGAHQVGQRAVGVRPGRRTPAAP